MLGRILHSRHIHTCVVWQAIVRHIGSTLDSGHYVCDVRRTPSEWTRHDGRQVAQVRHRVLFGGRLRDQCSALLRVRLVECSRQLGARRVLCSYDSRAYMLFYEKADSEKGSEETKQHEPMAGVQQASAVGDT